MSKSKGRMIRKDISYSHKISSLSKEAVILFLMMIPHLNSFGKMNGSPYYIKGEIVPLLDYLSIPIIEKCLKEITTKTNLKWFEYNGLWFIHSMSWEEHQDIEINKRGRDDMPDFSLLGDYSTTTPVLVAHKVKDKVEVKVKDKVEVKEEVKGDSAPPQFPEILKDLNEQTGKKYRDTKDTKELIRARWQDGFRLEDFKRVHSNMSAKWKDDPKMNQYLRPMTLYQAKKFEGYLNAVVTASDIGKVSEKLQRSATVFDRFINDGGQNGQAKI